MSRTSPSRGSSAERRAQRYARRRRRTARIIALLVVLGVGGGIAAALYSPLFKVVLVEVQGARLLDPQEVISVAAVGPQSNLLLITQNAVAQRMRALPRVASVTVRKYWPNRVLLEIEERRGMLLVPCGEVWFEVATDGMVIAMHHSAATGGMPLLTGLDTAALAVGRPLPATGGSESVVALAAIIAQGEQLTGAAVTARGLEANLNDGTALYLGQPGADLRTRTETALEILARLRAKGEQVAYIDVRVAGQPVVMPREASK